MPGFTDEDIAKIISDEDLRQRSVELDKAQEAWETLAYLAVEKIPCKECGGTGQVYGGSLGNICLGCDGQRVQEMPGAEAPEMPPFAQLRAAISAYGDAVIDRALPDGHRGKRNLALPSPSTVPTLEQIKKLFTEGVAKTKQLGDGAHKIDPKALPEPSKGVEGGYNDEQGDYTDAELDQMEPK